METTDLAKRDVGIVIAPAVAAAAANAKAEIEAAYTIAVMRPRDIDDVRERILKTCRRPSFAADTSAVYRKPVGGGTTVEGAGIRLAEEFARQMGNMRINTTLTHEDDETVGYDNRVTDLETNTSFNKAVMVHKVIERRKVRQGQTVVGQRETSKGDIVYLVRPSAEETVTKADALGSKAVRVCILRLVPQDIVEEAIATVKSTRMSSAANDPDGEARKVTAAFALLNILPKDLEQFLGCKVSQASPAQIADLRGVYGAVKDGEASWQEVIAAKNGNPNAPEEGTLDMGSMTPGDGESATGPGDVQQPAAVAPETPATANSEGEGGFPCPHCDRVLKSARGRTIHVASRHAGEAVVKDSLTAGSVPAEPVTPAEVVPTVELIDGGPAMDGAPKFTVVGVVTTGDAKVLVGAHQLEDTLFRCEKCGALDLTQGAGCPHLQATLKAIEETA